MAKSSNKSPYKKRWTTKQKKRLLEERKRVLEDIEADEAELLSWRDNSNGGVDQHPADGATVLTELELDVTLISNARYILAEIDETLVRIERGTYGWDMEGECWIREERLQALPWARHEIETQNRLEQAAGTGREGYSHDIEMTSF